MKKRFILVLTILTSAALNAQNKLTITVDGIENAKGKLLAAIYTKDSFLKAPPIAAEAIKIEGETVSTVFEIPSGEYAVSVFQDENENGKLDGDKYGIPTEKYGFSNNSAGKTGPPSFDDCKFTVDKNATVYITLI